MNAKESLLEQFKSGELAGKTADQILKILKIPFREKSRLLGLLSSLVDDGEIFLLQSGQYGTAEQLGLVVGTLTGNERGFAFLVPDDKQTYPEDFFIPRRGRRGAYHGDKVLALPVGGEKGDEAEVVCILERGFKQIVGTFYKDRNGGYLYPDEKRFDTHIFIHSSKCFKLPNAVKAVAKIIDYPYGKAPGGEIVEILGDEEDFFAEELSIIRSYNLREEFPADVQKQAIEAQKQGISPADFAARTDFRDKQIITIDGEDTRDIDDAISLEKVDGNYLLGVHIADVTHYVPHFSALDKEAYTRGTSVYFPDRVLPMLPRELSNGICSLNEGEDRLTLSCLITISPKGQILGSDLKTGVIRSAKRLTYTAVQAVLDGDKKAIQQNADVCELIRLCGELARLLKGVRDKKGSVNLEVKEVKILIDEKGEIAIPDFHRPFAYEIIEQFMVTANEAVAEFMSSIEAPFIYRVHERPSVEKAELFKAFAQSLGLTVRFSPESVQPYDYANLLKAAAALPVFPVLNRTMLRSMQKARYAPLNAGHFGLASKCYCHFTSPIRRYPDLAIHRIIKDVLAGGYDRLHEKYGRFVSDAAERSSQTERTATEAERDVDDLYMAAYMSERIGEEYDAIVSGVTSRGVFAELKNTVEGFIPVEMLEGSFEHIPERFMLKGSHVSFAIGEKIRVKVLDVDFYERRTTFAFLGKIQGE